jgi:hypothetical protein
VPPRLQSLLPDPNRHNKSKSALRQIQQKYIPQFSSPTRQNFKHILQNTAESEVNRRLLTQYKTGKAKREAKVYQGRKQLKGRSHYDPESSSVSYNSLRLATVDTHLVAQKKSRRTELRHQKKLINNESNRRRRETRDTYITGY